MVELVDATGSKPVDRKVVRVQVPPWAPRVYDEQTFKAVSKEVEALHPMLVQRAGLHPV